jgi:hypothetical protein
MGGMSEQAKPDEAAPDAPAALENDDDRRAEAAAVNRKRALEQWERNKKRWREMGVPEASPAKK